MSKHISVLVYEYDYTLYILPQIFKFVKQLLLNVSLSITEKCFSSLLPQQKPDHTLPYDAKSLPRERSRL